MLEVRLIGKFDIKSDGKPVNISSRVAQSLFAYLIVTARTLHRREKLAGMFWPEESEVKARAYLRTELWRIRKALPKTSKVEYLLVDDLTIGFNQSSDYWLDIEVVKNLSDGATVDNLMSGLLYYDGEFLPGFYEDWVVLEREHLQALYEQKIMHLLEMLEKEQSWKDVLKWAEQWISLGQAPEAAYRALMVAYDAVGDRSKVASTYERCVQALSELELEPSEQTRALAFKRMHFLNIPIPLTSFIGRERELREVSDLITKNRLVTLTGSGGMGKTRLSIQVIAEVLDLFQDGFCFLDLAPLNDSTLVPSTLANLIGLHESRDTKLSVTDLLINYFRSRTALIIFDNCEHLIEACAQLVYTLLTSCKSLSILATSQEALRVPGEIAYRVPSLQIPKMDNNSTIDTIANIESVRLFIERAALTSANFALNPQNAPIITHICGRLDGIPLAIELAAARANVLTVEQISKRLDDRFDLLTGGLRTTLPRHRTLRATIEWSYSLLSRQERLLFRRLAIFMGGWTLEAAEEICSGNGIESRDFLELLSKLVDKSLVVVETRDDAYRYRRLETIRQFAREKLVTSGEFEMICQHHLIYFLQLAERAEPEIRSHSQVKWLNLLEKELDNLRTALEWSKDQNTELCLRLISALWRFWDIRGYADEGIRWMSIVLSITESFRNEVRSRALARASQLASNNGFFTQAGLFAEEGYTLAKKLNDKPSMARALLILSTLELIHSREKTGLNFLKESLNLSREIEDRGLVASIMYNFAFQARNNDLVATVSFMEQGLQEARVSGDKRLISHGLQQLSLYSLMQGNGEKAQTLAKEALSLIQDMDDKANIMGCHWLFATIALFSENYVAAEEHSKMAERVASLLNDRQSLSISFKYLSLVSWANGDHASFGELTWKALSLAKERSDQLLIIELLVQLGEAYRLQRDLIHARGVYDEALAILQQENFRIGYCVCLEGIAALAITENQSERCACLMGAREKLRKITFVMDNTFMVDNYPFMVRQRQVLISAARLQLGEEAFLAAWQAGQEMSLEDALKYMVASIR